VGVRNEYRAGVAFPPVGDAGDDGDAERRGLAARCPRGAPSCATSVAREAAVAQLEPDAERADGREARRT
jgi:hypothetical protein